MRLHLHLPDVYVLTSFYSPRYVPEDPRTFREGDIVEVSFSVIGVRIRNNQVMLYLNLRALTLINDTIRKVGAVVVPRYNRILKSTVQTSEALADASRNTTHHQTPKRKIRFLQDTDVADATSTPKKPCIDAANTLANRAVSCIGPVEAASCGDREEIYIDSTPSPASTIDDTSEDEYSSDSATDDLERSTYGPLHKLALIDNGADAGETATRREFTGDRTAGSKNRVGGTVEADGHDNQACVEDNEGDGNGHEVVDDTPKDEDDMVVDF